MPQLQNLVLTDRALPPVEHTFTPSNMKDGVGEVVETQGVPIGNKRFTIQTKKTSTGKYRIEMRLLVPTVANEVVNGVDRPIVLRTAIVECSFVFDQTSLPQERQDFVGMFQSALDSSKVLTNDALIKLQGIYGA